MKLDKAVWKGSFILLVAFGLFNIFNFGFQFSMARLLSIVDYGIFATLFALFYILAVFTEGIQIVIARYTSEKQSKSKLKNILRKATKKSFSTAIILLVIYLILSVPLSYLLDIPYLLVALNGLGIIPIFILPITRGVMQGLKRFTSLGATVVAEGAAKLVFSIILVLLGWKIYGAIIGPIIGVAFAILVSLIPLRDILKTKEQPAKTPGIHNYSWPALTITFIVVAFYSVDLIIAKMLFTDEIAGVYAIASILAKIIFWGTLPISKVLFPLSSESSKDTRKTDSILINSFLILFACILVALIAYYFFSGLIVALFAGHILPEAASILFLLGIATSIIAVANMILMYKLSINKTKGYQYLLFFLLIEIALLYYFSNNLFQFSVAFITASTLLLWGSLHILGNR